METNKQDVYTMNADGTGVTNLTKNYTDLNWLGGNDDIEGRRDADVLRGGSGLDAI